MIYNSAWKMLRENYKSDSKGRHKTVHVMEVAKYFAAKSEHLEHEVERMHIYEAAIKRICSEQLYAIEYLQIAKQAVADYEASK